MQQREKLLLIVAGGAVVVWLGLPIFQRLFLTPIETRRAALTALSEELVETTSQVVEIKHAGASLKQWRERSLPPVPLDAQRLYQAWLTDLAQLSDFSDLRVTPGRRIERAGVFTGSLVSLEGKATLSQLSDFLRTFHRTDLLHRVVSLNVDSPATTGDPKLGFVLIAEGVSLAGSPPREHLFPQANLKSDFQSTENSQTIQVDTARLFPTGRAFGIRIGEEFLQVTKSQGTEWTVLGGREGSRPAHHKTGDTIELAPRHSDNDQRADESLQQLVAKSPFVKPKSAPTQVAVVSPPQPVRKPQPVDRSAEETFLAATINEDGQPQAWLYRNGTRRTVLRLDSKLTVGDIEATVQDIQADYVVLQTDDKLWRLRIGENLKSLEEIPKNESRPGAATLGDRLY